MPSAAIQAPGVLPDGCGFSARTQEAEAERKRLMIEEIKRKLSVSDVPGATL
jgi:hypothetical protein